MEKSLYSRSFEVNYYEVKEEVWRITSQLKDSQHDILVSLDVSVPNMIILDAKVDFIRYPMKNCVLIMDKMKELIGINIFTDFISKSNELFSGDMGCGNVRMLLGASVPAIIYNYFPHQMRIGKMTDKEWWTLCKDKLANSCICHTLLKN